MPVKGLYDYYMYASIPVCQSFLVANICLIHSRAKIPSVMTTCQQAAICTNSQSSLNYCEYIFYGSIEIVLTTHKNNR